MTHWIRSTRYLANWLLWVLCACTAVHAGIRCDLSPMAKALPADSFHGIEPDQLRIDGSRADIQRRLERLKVPWTLPTSSNIGWERLCPYRLALPSDAYDAPPAGADPGVYFDDLCSGRLEFWYRVLPSALLVDPFREATPAGVTDYRRQQLTMRLQFRIAKNNTSDHLDRVGPAFLAANCLREPVLVGFFNGVFNTEKSAKDSLDRLAAEAPPLRSDLPIKMKLFYNQTGCRPGALGKVGCIEDLVETFSQRNLELGNVFDERWETFWEMLSGRFRQPSSSTGTLLAGLASMGVSLLEAANATFNAMNASILSLSTRMLATPPTQADVSRHVEALTSHHEGGGASVLIGHSQGALFANAARAALVAASVDLDESRLLYVGPAAQPLYGDYVLSDLDLVINGLRLTGPSSVPPANLNMAFSMNDPSGHMFLASYMDLARPAYQALLTRLQAEMARL